MQEKVIVLSFFYTDVKMKCQTLIVFVIILVLLYFSIKSYNDKFYKDLIESIQYGVPRLPSPLRINTDHEEHFSQTMQDELSTIGSYRSQPDPMTSSQETAFHNCIDTCKQKINKCLAAGNPTSCEYNYMICQQDCGWTARQVVAPQH